jgi:PASTA domain
MADRLRALLPRVLVVTAVWIVASGTLTFAADKTLTAKVAAKPVAPAPKPTLIVPDVREQAYVFAKGILADGGFAWRVVGSVHGYATNVVASQSPAPGTRLVDTGAPTIVLHLTRGRYTQNGSPEDTAPYVGTAALPAINANVPAAKPPSGKLPLTPKKAVPAKKAAKLGHARPTKKKTTPTHAAKKTAHPAKTSSRRPAAFQVRGAPKEPLDEISLPARAKRLDAWLTPARHPTAANQRHWLYQHAWIVTGAGFGWWHGADALRILIRVDQRLEAQWGLGRRSELVARRALAAVEARAG